MREALKRDKAGDVINDNKAAAKFQAQSLPWLTSNSN
jgi:hypothetical protein